MLKLKTLGTIQQKHIAEKLRAFNINLPCH